MASRVLAYLLQQVTSWRGRLALPAALLMVLAAPSGAAAQVMTICHATGDPNTPYQQIDLQPADTIGHLTHEHDLVPAPPGGCPAQLVPEPTAEPDPQADIVPTATPAPAAPAPRRRGTRRRRQARRTPRQDQASAPAGSTAPATPAAGPLSATAVLEGQTLPMTGQDIPAVALMGLGFLLAGAGLRLRYAR